MVSLRKRIDLWLVLCAFLSLMLLGSARETRAQSVSFSGLWIQQSPANSPSARVNSSMAYDAQSGNVVLFGGYNGVTSLAGTWTWDGTNWTQLSPANSPSARSVASMAYDAKTGNVVLFGGTNSGISSILADTWTWDGTNWTQQSPANSPPARFSASMAYDANTGNVVLFGGTSSKGALADTWTWDGTNWTQQNPANSPPARQNHSMAYDAQSGYSGVVLFGGNSGNSNLADTWTWDGTNWTQQSPANSPSARYAASMAYDAQSGNAVLFGGGGSYLADTWIWDGTNWTQQKPANSPPGREAASMAYDAKSGKIVLFGGGNSGILDDTWTYQLGPVNMGSANVCPGSQTAPSPCSQTVVLAFNVSTTTTFNATTPVNVLTQGAANLDFTSTANTCTGTLTAPTTCTVTVKFAPLHPGLRMGAVQLLNSTGDVIASVLLKGIGIGPQAVFPSNSASNILGSGFSSPAGVAVDASGDVFVADSGNKEVKEIVAINGQVSSSSPVKTVGSGFSLPLGVAVDASGDVFVADFGSYPVKEIVAVNGQVSSSSPVKIVGSEFFDPSGVAVDSSGDVFVTDLDNNTVKEFVAINGQFSSSSPINTVGSGFLQPVGMAVDSSGDVFVADAANNAVKEIVAVNGQVSSSSQVNTVGSGFSSPDGVAVDASGDVFVADFGNNAVKEIVAVNGQVSSSSQVNTVGSGFSGGLAGVAVDGSDDVFVADANNNAVKELPLATAPSHAFPTATPVGSTDTTDGPFSVTVANDGNATLTFPIPASGNNPSVSANFAWDATSTCPQSDPSAPTAFTLAPGASCTAVIDFAPVTAGAINGSAVLTDNALNAASPNYATQTVTLAGTGSDFSFTPAPKAITVTAGATTNNTSIITVQSAGGFASAVSLTCAISPTAASKPATCAFSPASVTPAANGTATSTLTISTTATTTTTSINNHKTNFWPTAGGGTVLACLLFFWIPKKRRSWLAMVVLLVSFVSMAGMACGGGGGGGSSSGTKTIPGTTAGTYTVTVTGASGSLSHTAKVTLTVQ